MNVEKQINQWYNKSAIAGSRYSGGRPNGSQSSSIKQNLNDSINLTPDSASDLETGIQESCSGTVHFINNTISYNIL